MINGIETLTYGVEDLALCKRYFIDFGLELAEESDREVRFELAEGSTVIVRPLEDARVAGQKLMGFGVQQVVWGVPDQRTFERLIARLRNVTDVNVDSTGLARFFDCDGIAMGLRVYAKRPVFGAPSPTNSLGTIQRLNQHRKWKLKAAPKTIQHVVYMTPNPQVSWQWYRDNMGFLLSDVQEGFGIFARGSNALDHHNIYWLKADLPFPGLDGNTRFNHVNFGVEDLDEMMVGANYMERRGWPKSVWGLGRHRIASSLFLYLPCPAGGEAEYGADSDMLDESWIPRRWNARFGTGVFMHNLPTWMHDDLVWDYGYVEGATPAPPGKKGKEHT